jgi:predicted nucleic acid-binding Zn ribbon protein
MTATATATGCAACGQPLPPSKGNRARKWCSERCRRTKYAYPCVDCGDMIPHDGRVDRHWERCRKCAVRFQPVRHDVPAPDGRAEPRLRLDGHRARRGAAVPGHQRPGDGHRLPGCVERRPGAAVGATIVGRFGTWGQACRAAGLEDHGYGIRSDRLTAEGAMLAFADCAAELDGRPPTINEYTAWAQRTGSPCQSLLRWRWGSWTRLVNAYLEQKAAA